MPTKQQPPATQVERIHRGKARLTFLAIVPGPSMDGGITYVYHHLDLNVRNYSIHGLSGVDLGM